jgi:hypothetical protein
MDIKIDQDRIGCDLAYWNKIAPEGATHLIDNDIFTKWIAGHEWQYSTLNKNWGRSCLSYSVEKYNESIAFDIVAKPTQTLPPLGVECEYRNVGGAWLGRTCIPIAFHSNSGQCWLKKKLFLCSEIYITSEHEFRPLKSKEERDYEVLLEKLTDDLMKYWTANTTQLAKLLLDKGWNLG